jgi:hypothetical protein
MSSRHDRRRARAIGGLALAIGFACAVAAPASAAVSATISPTTAYNVNNRQVDSGPSANRTYTVTSTGADPLILGQAAFSGADAGQFAIASDSCSGATLAQAQTCTVAVNFTPTLTGARSTALEIPSNATTITTAAIAGTGRDLGASATQLAFSGRVGGGAGTAQTVTLTNDDGADYTLGAVTIGGSNGNQFVKTADTCSSATLTANGGSCSVSVAFQPTAPGAKTAALAIGSFGPNPVTLSGNAEQPATALAPGSLAFADRALADGPSAAQELTLTNTGVGPLAVGDVALAGTDAGQFTLTADGCGGATLAGGQSCTVAVAFDPATAGYRRARVEIATDAAGPPTVGRLGGRGKGSGTDTVFDAPLDLLAEPIARLQCDGGDTVGGAVASGPCDVDGDGFDDVVAGAPLWSRTPVTNSWEGGAYVYFGGPDAGSADLANPQGRAILLEGEQPGGQTGTGIGCADVDGDGIDDVLVGAWAYEYAGRPAGTAAARGRAYVVYGAADLREQGPLDLGALGERGFQIDAPDAPEYDHLGYQVVGLGDLDGDGRDEIGVMANTGDTTDATPARSNNGIVWVVPGQTGSETVDVSDPGATLLRIDGASPASTASPFGQMIGLAGVGDVDGDRVGDIAIGTYTAVAFGRSTASGAAFAVSGAQRGRIDLGDPSSYLFAVGGAFAGHRLGISVAAAGDVDGDGLADLAIGADSTASANTDAAYVVYGSQTRPAGDAILDAADLGARGYRIRGATGSSAGYAVDGVGDVDGDGSDDLVVGVYGADPAAGAGAGSAYVVYGVPDPSVLPDHDPGLVPVNAADATHYLALADLTPAQGTRVDGQTAGERFGRALAGVGDVDGNGAADVAFGSDQAERRGRSRAGEVAVALLPGPAPLAEPGPPVTIPDPPAPEPPTRTAPRPLTTAVPGLAARTLRADRRGRVALRVRCAGTRARCWGRLRLRVAGRSVGSVKFSVRAGERRTLRVRLPRKLRRLLAERGRLSGRATLVVHSGGTRGTAERTLKLTVRRPVDR